MSPIISRSGFSLGFGKRRGGGPPTYSISPSAASVNEGSSVTFTVTTANVPNGTTLYFSTNVITGTVNSSDFSDSAITGSFTITNNTATITRTLTNDVTTEGPESFQLQVRTGSTSGTIVATSSTVTIGDTSITPPTISATGGTVSTPGDGFKYHAFTSTGPSSFVVSSNPGNINITVLIVGGGGSGSGGWGGSGGGAGGVLYSTAFPTPVATYPVIVGSGKNNSSQNNPGTPGDPSSFNGISVGGGVAGEHTGGGGGPGGAQGSCSPTGSFTAYGPNGGGPAPAGGGGGAGGAASGNNGGVGVRIPAFLNYGTPGPAGSGGYFAGGGSSQSVPNAGAVGGGSNSPTPAIVNTGGGGGSTNDGYPNTSAPGIVLIRYTA